MLTTSVQALRPESRSRFRIVLAQEWFRERFWVVPTALLVAGMAVGVAVSRADSIPGLEKVGGGLPVRAGSAEALLGIIAASMLTFVGVVFTITLVALQLASAQLSPASDPHIRPVGHHEACLWAVPRYIRVRDRRHCCGGCVIQRRCAPPRCHAWGFVCVGEPGRAETVDLAFTEIAIYGASSPAVTRRLAAAYEHLHQSIPFDLRVDVAWHMAVLEPLASGAIQPEHPMATPARIDEDLADDIAAA